MWRQFGEVRIRQDSSAALPNEVQKDVLAALREAPAEWFSKRDHSPDWPYDLLGHSASHRVKDIERALAKKPS